MFVISFWHVSMNGSLWRPPATRVVISLFLVGALGVCVRTLCKRGWMDGIEAFQILSTYFVCKSCKLICCRRTTFEHEMR